MTVAVIWYSPPTAVSKVQVTGSSGRADGAVLDVDRFLAPVAPRYFHSSRAAWTSTGRSATGIAVQIGDDDFDLQRCAPLDKGALAAQADVEFGRVHQQAGGRRPGLAVDVHHRRLGQHAEGPERVGLLEIQRR